VDFLLFLRFLFRRSFLILVAVLLLLFVAARRWLLALFPLAVFVLLVLVVGSGGGENGFALPGPQVELRQLLLALLLFQLSSVRLGDDLLPQFLNTNTINIISIQLFPAIRISFELLNPFVTLIIFSSEDV